MLKIIFNSQIISTVFCPCFYTIMVSRIRHFIGPGGTIGIIQYCDSIVSHLSSQGWTMHLKKAVSYLLAQNTYVHAL